MLLPRNRSACRSTGRLRQAERTGVPYPLVESLENRSLLSVSLDHSWGGDGLVVTRPDGGFGNAFAVARQDDGKVLIAGSRATSLSTGRATAVVRYHANGMVDTMFGQGGTAISDFQNSSAAFGVSVMGDGRILTVGPSADGVAISRFLPTGAADLTFGEGGTGATFTDIPFGSVDAAFHAEFRPDGKIVVAAGSGGGTGSTPEGRFALLRYLPDGVLDTTFGNGGMVIEDHQSHSFGGLLRLLDSGDILVGGIDRIVRFNADGERDASFGSGGEVFTGYGHTMLLEVGQNGKITLATVDVIPEGWVEIPVGDVRVSRFNADGSVDPGFGAGGVVTLATDGIFDRYRNVGPSSVRTAHSLGVHPLSDGRFLAFGPVEQDEGHDFAVAQFTADGQPDPTFSDNGPRLVTGFSEGSDDLPFRYLLSNDGFLVIGSTMEDPSDPTTTAFASARYVFDDVTPPPADTTAPAAFLRAATPQVGAASLDLIFDYADDVALDLAALDVSDLQVVGPGGVTVVLKSASIVSQTSTTATVIYQLEAPGGTFDVADNGTYSVRLLPGAVEDVAGNFAAVGEVGSFTVAVTPDDEVPVPPYLSVTVGGTLPVSAIAGAKVKAAPVVTIINSGDSPIVGLTTVRFVASADPFVDNGDAVLGTVAKNLKLNPGADKRLKLKLRSLPALADGSYFLLARVTSSNGVVTNSAADRTVVVAAPFIDWTGSFVAGAPATLVRGQKLIAGVSVGNAGNASASGIVTISVFASVDGSFSDDDHLLVTATRHLKLKPGASKLLRLKGVVPQSVALGEGFILATVVAAQPLVESNLSNNTAAAGITIN